MAAGKGFRNIQTVVSLIEDRVRDGRAHEVQLLTGSLSNNNSRDFLCRTPLELALGFNAIFSLQTDLEFEVYEGPTVISDGTEVPAAPLNRVNPVPITTQFFVDPVMTDDGTLVFKFTILEESRNSRSLAQQAPFILKNDEVYLLRITNVGGSGAQNISLDATFYEVNRVRVGAPPAEQFVTVFF